MELVLSGSCFFCFFLLPQMNWCLNAYIICVTKCKQRSVKYCKMYFKCLFSQNISQRLALLVFIAKK